MIWLRRTQCRELPLCAGSGEGCQWQGLPSPVQCKETATRTRNLPVTGGKTLPLAHRVLEKTGNFTMQRKKNSFNLWARLIRILRMLSSDLAFLTGMSTTLKYYTSYLGWFHLSYNICEVKYFLRIKKCVNPMWTIVKVCNSSC